MPKTHTLKGSWIINAPIEEVYEVVADFEKYPERFPRVAKEIKILEREGNHLKIEALIPGITKPLVANMTTELLPGKGFISDNYSTFGTSGHEEFLLTEVPEGTQIDYTYDLQLHTKFLQWFGVPLLNWISLPAWKRAVIDKLRELLEKE